MSRVGFVGLLNWPIGTDRICFNAKALCRGYCFSDGGKSYFYYVDHIAVSGVLMNQREVSLQKKPPFMTGVWLSFLSLYSLFNKYSDSQHQ